MISLQGTYREMLQEVFDMEETLDYDIERDATDVAEWWKKMGVGEYIYAATIRYQNEEGEEKTVILSIQYENFTLPANQKGPKKYLFEIAFRRSDGDVEDITNDQVIIPLLNTMAHILISFLNANYTAFFDEENPVFASFDLSGIKSPFEGEDEKPKRERIYDHIIYKNLNQLRGEWDYDETSAALKNKPFN